MGGIDNDFRIRKQRIKGSKGNPNQTMPRLLFSGGSILSNPRKTKNNTKNKEEKSKIIQKIKKKNLK